MNNFHFGFSFLSDPLSLLFLAIIFLGSLPAAVFSIGYQAGHYSPRRKAAGWALLAAFILSMAAVVTAGDAFMFLIAWELMSLLSYFLVMFDDTRDASLKAGTIYLVMTHVGTAFITAAFMILYAHAGSFDLGAFKTAAASLTPPTRSLVFLLFLIGFGTKAGMVPLHVWLPYAHPQAPGHVSSIMSGVMIKTAVYGLLRFVVSLMGADAAWWGGLILLLAAASAVVGVMSALAETDLKKVLAYSSVENMGVILMGIGASMLLANLGAPRLSVLAMTAGLFHLLNHAVFKSLLFMGAGSVHAATGVRNMELLGGLIRRMPWTAAAFLAGAMAISGLPPFNGFASEWLMLQTLFLGALGTTGGARVLLGLTAAALAFAGGLAAACFVRAFGLTFLAMPRSERAARAHEGSFSMIAPMMFLAACALGLGIGAAPAIRFLSGIAASVTGLETGAPGFALNGLTVSPQAGGAMLSVPFAAAMLLAVALAAFAVRKAFMKKPVTTGRTWDCGYYRLDARTEYTATAFSKPFRIAFSFFFLPYRKTRKVAETAYHVKTFKYEPRTGYFFKKYLYGFALSRVLRTARWMRRLQAGSMHVYIAYIFFTVIALIVLLNRI